jgi:hypothetical protein
LLALFVGVESIDAGGSGRRELITVAQTGRAARIKWPSRARAAADGAPSENFRASGLGIDLQF